MVAFVAHVLPNQEDAWKAQTHCERVYQHVTSGRRIQGVVTDKYPECFTTQGRVDAEVEYQRWRRGAEDRARG